MQRPARPRSDLSCVYGPLFLVTQVSTSITLYLPLLSTQRKDLREGLSSAFSLDSGRLSGRHRPKALLSVTKVGGAFCGPCRCSVMLVAS